MTFQSPQVQEYRERWVNGESNRYIRTFGTVNKGAVFTCLSTSYILLFKAFRFPVFSYFKCLGDREFLYADKGHIFKHPEGENFLPSILGQLYRLPQRKKKLTPTSRMSLVHYTPIYGGTETDQKNKDTWHRDILDSYHVHLWFK